MAPIEPNGAIRLMPPMPPDMGVPAIKPDYRATDPDRKISELRNVLFGDTAWIGIDDTDEIFQLVGEAKSIIGSITKKYPTHPQMLVLAAKLYNIVTKYSYMGRDKPTFDLAISLFKETNIRIREMVNEDCNAEWLKSSLESLKAELDLHDERALFHNKYGIELVFNEKDMFWSEKRLINNTIPVYFHLGDASVIFMNTAIRRIEAAINRLPRELVDRLPRRIPVTHFGGAAEDGERFFLSPNQDTIAHEIFHYFDAADDTTHLCGFCNSDDPQWKRIAGKTGPMNVEDLSASYSNPALINRPNGYAYDYGLKNIHEDQATVAEMLFTAKPALLRNVLAADEKLRIKVELITGCQYDTATGTFVKLYTRRELWKKYGLSDHIYYARWSNVNGRILMDAQYWNNILEQNAQPQ